MAKAKTTKAPKEKKTSFLKNNFVLINDFDGVQTHAMHIRTMGVVVRETHTKSGSVTSTFIPGAKIKTKKDYKYLIMDKGPKPKKKKGE